MISSLSLTIYSVLSLGLVARIVNRSAFVFKHTNFINFHPVVSCLSTQRRYQEKQMGVDGKFFTLAQVSEHNTPKDCWLIINGKVLSFPIFYHTIWSFDYLASWIIFSVFIFIDPSNFFFLWVLTQVNWKAFIYKGNEDGNLNPLHASLVMHMIKIDN